jgi:hypothetical protein
MTAKQEGTICGIDVPPEERTPLVEQLLRVIFELRQENEKLRAEVDRLKDLPERPRRPQQPSTLNDPQGKPSQVARRKRRKRRGKRPGSAKRAKTRRLKVHETVPLKLNDVPEGTERLGYADFYVQDLKVEAHNIRYRRARYRLPDGSFRTAPLPDHVASHFGSTLRAYILYQHFHNHVTQPLLHEELRELGVDISAGEVNRLLTEGHDAFHEEKDALLPAAREVSRYFHTDDTSARHRGQNGHTLHIGNELFASFFTTDSKSRSNFLKVLRSPFTDYVLGGDALFYLEYYGLPKYLQTRLAAEVGDGAWVVEGDEAWEKQLDAWQIKSADHRRLITEAALFGSLLAHDLYVNQPLVSDDAAQFKVLGLMVSLCWLHAERHVARLIPLNAREQKAYDKTRDAIWQYYQRLKAYRESPTTRRKALLERDFDRLFQQRTGFPALNEALRKIHAKKENLLLVLERPELPLHNNPSESDIRQYVKKRKISAGTRSDDGRRCRDTFLSLKTTCRKLGVAFWHYLRDRINGLNTIPLLCDLIRQKAATAA